MRLNDLFAPLQALHFELPPELPAAAVHGIQFDSRQVAPGDLFIAVEGGSFDGHTYIADAVGRGALAVVGSKQIPQPGFPYIRVDDTRQALAWLSAAFYGFPARQMTVIGVTGTDGKTTTVNLLFRILLACGLRAGMISTVNAVIGEEVIDTGFHVTTPEAPTVQRLLRKMLDAGLTHVVLETTSHGLAQQRVTACEFDIGVITNITHEHLDYHGDYQGYLGAKARLLTGLAETVEKTHGNIRLAVLNADDISCEPLKVILADPQYASIQQAAYGRQPGLPVSAANLRMDAHGLSFDLLLRGASWFLSSGLIGEYNLYNILAAVTAASLGLKLPMDGILRGVRALPGVPGRMQSIDLGQDFLAIVDFAHTPNALKVALETANKMKGSGRVISVFGSAGLRDRQKRRMMAAVSLDLADLTILTAEDPRTESLNGILAEMADEATKHGGVEGKNFLRVPDRGQAIRQAVLLAQPGDIVLACGKGHEQSMCFGQTEYDWDDRQAMRAALSERLGRDGPPMPFLPTQSPDYSD